MIAGEIHAMIVCLRTKGTRSHLDAMLGIAYIKMGCGEIVEAESLLITAVRKYPINSNAWYNFICLEQSRCMVGAG